MTIKEAFENIDPAEIDIRIHRYNEIWKALFDFYNKMSGEKRLDLNCRPCYAKVYYWVRNFLRMVAIKQTG